MSLKCRLMNVFLNRTKSYLWCCFSLTNQKVYLGCVCVCVHACMMCVCAQCVCAWCACMVCVHGVCVRDFTILVPLLLAMALAAVVLYTKSTYCDFLQHFSWQC